MFDMMLSVIGMLVALRAALFVLRAPPVHGGLLNLERYSTPEDDPFAGLVIAGRPPLLLRFLFVAMGLDSTAELRADDTCLRLRYPTLQGVRTVLIPHSALSQVHVREQRLILVGILGLALLIGGVAGYASWASFDAYMPGRADPLYYTALSQVILSVAFFFAFWRVRPLRLAVAAAGDHLHGMTILPGFVEGMWVGRESLEDFAHQLQQRIERARRVREDVQPATVAMRRLV